eukprot:1147865-Pelagomonas_calceolata.AAC.8
MRLAVPDYCQYQLVGRYQLGGRVQDTIQRQVLSEVCLGASLPVSPEVGEPFARRKVANYHASAFSGKEDQRCPEPGIVYRPSFPLEMHAKRH